jgi:cell division protease FtsH
MTRGRDIYPETTADLSGISVERPKGPGLATLAGMEEARAFGENLALDLKDYKAGNISWSAVDPGCVFYGPPGTGKTTLARAIAAECGVAFIATSYADWTSDNGSGSDIIAQMKETFAAARRNAPCILFIDELDSLPKRGTAAQNNSFFQVLVNSALEHIGSSKNQGVIVIAACNDPSNLDPALIRSGRLDRMIEVPLPSPEALPGIFKIHLGIDVLNVHDLDRMALHCIGKSGADIVKIVREARRIARRAKSPLGDEHLYEAICASVSKLSPEALRVIAVHEAGHAAVAFRQGHFDRIIISLASSSTFSQSSKGAPMTRESVKAELVRLLAGRAAEEVLLGEPSGGAGGADVSDLARASQLALEAITRHGLSSSGRLLWHPSAISRPFADSYCGEEADHWLGEANESALAQIRNDSLFVAMIAHLLIRHGVLNEGDLRRIADSMETLPPQTTKSELLGDLGFAPRNPSASSKANGEVLGA